MNFFARLFGAGKPAQRESRPPSQIASGHSQYSQNSQSAPPSQSGTRREMLRVVLRDTLNRHGIPTWWVTAETLNATSRTRPPGIHWRLSVKHWDPRLMLHAVALEQALISRAQTFDPMVETWLMGISWQFALNDESVCPPMPHPGLWTADPRPIDADSVRDSLPGGSADVIAGPVRIHSAFGEVKADLDRLLAVRDAEARAHARTGGSSDATRPMFIQTEPAKLERER